MPMNAQYHSPGDLADVIPVFPLPGALLLPRGQMPLNIFEPRYLAMIDDSLRDGHRLIGMIQPDPAHAGPPDKPPLGPFYELETSSPALGLAPGERYTHVHRTFHLVGPEAELDRIARATLHVGLGEITAAFAGASSGAP